MIGRASIGYPWIFKEIKHYIKTGEILEAPCLTDRVQATRDHVTMSVEWKGERTGLVEMRRHYANYFKGIPNFKEKRMKLVTSDSLEEVLSLLEEIETLYV